MRNKKKNHVEMMRLLNRLILVLTASCGKGSRCLNYKIPSPFQVKWRGSVSFLSCKNIKMSPKFFNKTKLLFKDFIFIFKK